MRTDQLRAGTFAQQLYNRAQLDFVEIYMRDREYGWDTPRIYSIISKYFEAEYIQTIS